MKVSKEMFSSLCLEKRLNRFLSHFFTFPSTVEETAIEVFKESRKQEFFDGRNSDLVLGAIIYCSCRMENYPIQPAEVSERLDVEHTRLVRLYKRLIKELNITPPLPDSQTFVERYGDELNLSKEVINEAKDIISVCLSNNLQYGSPSAFAAAAIYTACDVNNVRLTQKRLSKVSGKSTVTIRNWYKEQKHIYQTQ